MVQGVTYWKLYKHNSLHTVMFTSFYVCKLALILLQDLVNVLLNCFLNAFSFVLLILEFNFFINSVLPFQFVECQIF